MWHKCSSCLLRVQDDGCSLACLRLMTRLHYNTQLCTRLMLRTRGDTTHSDTTHSDTHTPTCTHTSTQMPPCLIPRESVKFDYGDFYKHTPYESRRSIHQEEGARKRMRRKEEEGRDRETEEDTMPGRAAVWKDSEVSSVGGSIHTHRDTHRRTDTGHVHAVSCSVSM